MLKKPKMTFLVLKQAVLVLKWPQGVSISVSDTKILRFTWFKIIVKKSNQIGL